MAGLRLTGVGGVTLWSPDTPRLYTLRTTVSSGHAAAHSVATRIGFREAVFRPDGFFLNGQRLEIFGLNRHQLFPYTGMAACARLQRRDAERLRYELNCVMVRCSHYPQSPHFLDACDEIGLMVWAEAPGWRYVGDAAWQDLAVANARDMVLRDRNRPSVIVWATRLNETDDYPRLYARTRRAARDLDGTRQTTGAMIRHSTAGWDEDVFGYDDYHSRPAPGLSCGHRCPMCPTWSVRRWGRWTARRDTAGPTLVRCLPCRHSCTHRSTTSPGEIPGMPGCWAGRESTTRH